LYEPFTHALWIYRNMAKRKTTGRKINIELKKGKPVNNSGMVNHMKKFLSVLTASILSATMLASCGDNGGSSQSSNEMKKIGVVQIIEHKSLDTIRDSFTEQMETLGYKDGENCSIQYKSAQGDQNTLNSIIQGFQGDKVDVIVAIATPTAQAAASAAKDIPVVFSAVTDPVAAGLVSDMDKPDKNITGTSDAVQVEKILDLALQLTPDIKTLGVLYNTGEANSESNLQKAKAFADEHGLTIVEGVATNTSEVQQAAQVLADKVDAIFAPNDNTIANAMAAVAEVTKKAKVPVYTGADSMVSDGGFATIGIDYTELGHETANMADAILKGTSTADLPVKVFKDDLNTYINETTAAEIGVTIPDEILNGERTVLMQ